MEVLKKLVIWLVWKYEEKKGKKTKVPYSAKTLFNTGTSQKHSIQWTGFDEAIRVAKGQGFDGIGFVIPDGYGVIDIDHADDVFIKEVHDLVNSYMEKSPSGEGVHIIFSIDKNQIPQEEGKLDSKYYVNNRTLGVEIYIGGLTSRYMTFTGNALTDERINDCTESVISFLEKYMNRKSVTKEKSSVDSSSSSRDTDEQTLKRARKAKNGLKFCKLYDQGDWDDYPSESEADQALCNILAFWAKGDGIKIDRLFRLGALYREKWEQEDYRKKTIENAIAVYKSGAQNGEKERPNFIYVDDNGKEKISCPLLAKHFRENESMLSVLDNNMGKVLRYVYRDGCYTLFNEDMVKGLIKDYIANYDEKLIQMRHVNEVYQQLCADTNYISSDSLNQDENIINFQNGVLSIKSMELMPHDPNILSTIQIPCNWTGSPAPTPVFDSFMETFTDHDCEIQELLLEFMGVVISNVKGYRMKKALFIVGPGDAGKSILKSLTEKMIGKGNYMPTDLQELEERFGTGYIVNKRLVGTSDMSFMTLKEIKSFKKCTGGDSQFGEFKREIGFELIYNGVLWFCMNRLPKFGGDDGNWVYDRIIIVKAPNSIPSEKQDKNLLEKLYDERDGIVFKAVMALKNVIKNGYRYTEPLCVKNARKFYKAENNTVIAFFNECIVTRADQTIKDGCTTGKVYKVYQAWCKDNNHGFFKTAKEFRNDLASHLNVADYTDLVVHMGSGRYFKSYTLSEEAKDNYRQAYGFDDASPVEENPFLKGLTEAKQPVVEDDSTVYEQLSFDFKPGESADPGPGLRN